MNDPGFGDWTFFRTRGRLVGRPRAGIGKAMKIGGRQ